MSFALSKWPHLHRAYLDLWSCYTFEPFNLEARHIYFRVHQMFFRMKLSNKMLVMLYFFKCKVLFSTVKLRGSSSYFFSFLSEVTKVNLLLRISWFRKFPHYSLTKGKKLKNPLPEGLFKEKTVWKASRDFPVPMVL